ncbi:MAG: hemolysin family protein [Bryobacteraceae bacterium]
MTILIIVVCATLAISAACSLFEATLFSTRTAAVEAERAGGPKAAAAVRFLLMKEHISVPTAAILILNTVANTAGATLAGMYSSQVLGPVWVPLFSAVLTLAILFLAEILPKTFGAVHWKTLWPYIVYPLSAMETLLRPMIFLTEWFTKLFLHGHVAPVITQEEIRAMVKVGANSGELSTAEHELIEAVLRFKRLFCRQVMLPRDEVVFFDVDMTYQEAISIAQETKHTRYPLCEGSLDEVVGVVHIKDMLAGAAQESLSLRKIARPPRYVPESMPIDKLFRQMNVTRQHMAFVVNEFGTPVGIVTHEILMEQILGSVEDEFDMEIPDIVPQQSGAYLVPGRVSLDKLNRELSLDLNAARVNTLSGLLVSELGRFPKPGDVVDFGSAVAEVKEVEGKRATVVHLTVHSCGDPGSED